MEVTRGLKIVLLRRGRWTGGATAAAAAAGIEESMICEVVFIIGASVGTLAEEFIVTKLNYVR